MEVFCSTNLSLNYPPSFLKSIFPSLDFTDDTYKRSFVFVRQLYITVFASALVNFGGSMQAESNVTFFLSSSITIQTEI